MSVLAADNGANVFERMYTIEVCRAFQGCVNAAGDLINLYHGVSGILESSNLAGRLQAKIKGPIRYHHLLKVALAGCPNACSQPQIKDIGVVCYRRPRENQADCDGCGACADACRERAISFDANGLVKLDRAKCLACGECLRVCPGGGLASESQGYRLLLGGKLGRHPSFAREVGEYSSQAGLEKALQVALTYFLERAEGEERMGALLQRRGSGELTRLLRETARNEP